MPHAPSGNALNDAPTNVCLGSDTMEVRPVEVYEADDDEEVGEKHSLYASRDPCHAIAIFVQDIATNTVYGHRIGHGSVVLVYISILLFFCRNLGM